MFGYTLKSVLSGSMEPEFNTGSLILVKEIADVKELQKGDVITFMQDANTAVTHRIVDITKQGDHLLFKTKGDNNAKNPIQRLYRTKMFAHNTQVFSFHMQAICFILPVSRLERLYY